MCSSTQAAAAQSHGHLLSAALGPPLREVREAHFAVVAVAHEIWQIIVSVCSYVVRDFSGPPRVLGTKLAAAHRSADGRTELGPKGLRDPGTLSFACPLVLCLSFACPVLVLCLSCACPVLVLCLSFACPLFVLCLSFSLRVPCRIACLCLSFACPLLVLCLSFACPVLVLCLSFACPLLVLCNSIGHLLSAAMLPCRKGCELSGAPLFAAADRQQQRNPIGHLLSAALLPCRKGCEPSPYVLSCPCGPTLS